MLDKIDSALSFHQEALSLRARRQEVLSSNIAHSDTPDFKARDFDFSSKLSQAIDRGRQSQSMAMTTTSTRHLSSVKTASSVEESELLFRTPSQSSLDGNTVEMDVERVNFADNAMRYEANLTVISSKIKSMLSAVQ
jgi:flagellar basal-body rod protein FlgB